MRRKRVALEDAGLTVLHLADSCVLLCWLEACLQQADDYRASFATQYFPLIHEAPGTWPSGCFSNSPGFLVCLFVFTSLHFKLQLALPAKHLPRSLHLRLHF